MQKMTASHLLMEWNLLKNVEYLPESPTKGMLLYNLVLPFKCISILGQVS